MSARRLPAVLACLAVLQSGVLAPDAARAQPAPRGAQDSTEAVTRGVDRNQAPAPRPPRLLTLAGANANAATDTGSVTFVGTATVLIRWGGITVMTDPNFLHKGDHVHLGYGLRSRRLTDPAIRFEDLPPIDLVLLSHLHGDHFDQLVRKRLNRDIPIVTTAHATKELRANGFRAVHALRTWETLAVRKGDTTLRLTSMPGRHGPTGFDRALPPVMGTVLDFGGSDDRPGFRMYITGDTLVFDDIREIPKRYPGIDLALLHLGGTRILKTVLVTMDAKQGIEMMRIIEPKTAVPIHFDDYTVFESPLSDFVRAVREAGLQDRVRYLARGETLEFRLTKDPAAR